MLNHFVFIYHFLDTLKVVISARECQKLRNYRLKMGGLNLDFFERNFLFFQNFGERGS